MRNDDLKLNIHKIVDGIQDENLLQTLHDFLKLWSKNPNNRSWESLTEDQKKDMMLEYKKMMD